MTPSAADSIQARAIRFQPSTQVALGLSECPRTVSTMDSETQALASPPPSHYRLQPRPSDLRRFSRRCSSSNERIRMGHSLPPTQRPPKDYRLLFQPSWARRGGDKGPLGPY